LNSYHGSAGRWQVAALGLHLEMTVLEHSDIIRQGREASPIEPWNNARSRVNFKK